MVVRTAVEGRFPSRGYSGRTPDAAFSSLCAYQSCGGGTDSARVQVNTDVLKPTVKCERCGAVQRGYLICTHCQRGPHPLGDIVTPGTFVVSDTPRTAEERVMRKVVRTGTSPMNSKVKWADLECGHMVYSPRRPRLGALVSCERCRCSEVRS